MTDVEDSLVGQTIQGRYEVLSCLDRAGSARIYKVKDNSDGVIRALRLLGKYQEEKLEYFLAEAEKVKNQIKHPNLAKLLDFGVVRDSPAGTFVYLIYDYLSGRSLYNVLNRQGRIELNEALPVFIQICQVVQHLHAAGVPNLNLSPRKIIVSDQGQPARLSDTGLSSVLNTLSLEPGDSASPFPEGVLYSSPEQCALQPVDHRSDVYSLGCIMYECLVGLPPFLSKSPYEVSRMHISEEAKPLRMSRDDLNFPLELDLLVLKALRKNSHQRQQSVNELLEDLEHVQSELAKVPEMSLAEQESKKGWFLTDLFQDLSDLFGMDSSLKVKLAVPVILGLVVVFGSIAVANMLPRSIKTADPQAAAEQEAERQWQQLDTQAQRDFDNHNLASAENHLEKALQIAEKFADDRDRLLGTLQKLQNIYMAQKRYDKSDAIEARMKTIMNQFPQ